MSLSSQLRPRAPWLWLAAALIAVGVLSAFRASYSTGDTPLSARNARPDGALALALWLERLGYRVQVLSATPLRIGSLAPRSTTLMFLTPGADVSQTDVASTLRWMRSGGRVVVAADLAGSNLVAGLRSYVVPADALPAAVTQPLLLSPPASRLRALADMVISGDGPAAVAAGTPQGPVLALRRVGSGWAWLLTISDALQNDTIAAADNRRLALNLAGPPGSAVIFDEVAPAGRPAPPTGDWLTGSPWGISLLFGLGIILLYRLTGGWRMGPPITPLGDRHRPAAEYVVSLAGLLRRGRKRDEALSIYQRGLRRALIQRFGPDAQERLDPGARQEVERLLSSPPALGERDLLARAADIVEWEDRLRRGRVGGP